MVDFETIEHTADWALRVQGRDLEELFVHAAWGLNSLLVSEQEVIPKNTRRRFELDAFDPESLLVEFLGELLYWAEQERLLFREFEMLSLTSSSLVVIARGGIISALDKHVKAVTYHDLRIVQTGQGLKTTIVFDI